MFQAIVIACVLALVGLDQLTKWLIVELIGKTGRVTVIPGLFDLTYLENSGAAFGLLQGARWVFVVLTGITMALLLWLLLFGKFRRFRLFNISMILIIAGGIGNLIDRILNGYVVDFLHVFLKTVKINFDFPVFNFADCCVVIGSILLILFFCFFYDDTPSQEETHEPDHSDS